MNASNYYVSLTIQLNIIHSLLPSGIIKEFYFKQFNLAFHLFALSQTVLFDPLLGPSQLLQVLTKVDLEAMGMKWYYAFTKPQYYWSLIINVFSLTFRWAVIFPCSDAVAIFNSPTRLGYMNEK